MASSRKRVLVVDDDSDFLESMHLALMLEGHEVLTAAGGRDALARYAEFGPDIVFLDVKMPGMDGYETFVSLMRQDRDSRIVLTSSYTLDDEKYREAEIGGLRGVMNKPVEPDTMLKMIRLHAK